MKRKHFEASICRESDRHDWRFFVSWFEDGEWVSCLFDATPDGLDQVVRMPDIRSNTRQVIEAYLRACDLNDHANWRAAS